ncbi:hypothetical protein VPH35_123152 [Triticum aestivum]
MAAKPQGRADRPAVPLISPRGSAGRKTWIGPHTSRAARKAQQRHGDSEGNEREEEAAKVDDGEEEEAMASGWGINGNKGRCYDFWLDFSSCMSRCRQPSDCGLLREDYLECLHHSKEFQRRNRIYKEEQRQIRAAARKAKEEAEGAPAVAAHH